MSDDKTKIVEDAVSLPPQPQEGLEDLLRKLHGQIKSSDWLEKNTAASLEMANPELIRAWKEAVQPDNQNSDK